MKPKKQSNANLVIYVIMTVIVTYFMLHLSYCQAYVEVLIKKNEIAEKEKIAVIFKTLLTRISQKPLDFVFTAYTFNTVLLGLVFCILIIASIETSKRNYIKGKEYGTARWGKLSDIKMLFSEVIAQKEINELSKRKSAWGRNKLYKRIKAKCIKDGQIIKNTLIEDAEIENAKLAELQSKGVDISSHPKPKTKKEINEEIDELVNATIKNEWKPLLYKEELDANIKKLEENPLYRDKDAYTSKVAQLKKEYTDKCKVFYNDPYAAIRIKAKYRNSDILLTKTERFSMLNRQSINNNTLIIGGSGSGKTRGFVMPSVLQAHSSYVITDPKGEIVEKSGYFLEKEKDYKVRVLDMVDKERSSCFNPFHYLHPDRSGYQERVISLVETIMINTEGEKESSSDPFWPKAERMFLQALIYAIPKAFLPKYQTFATLLELIAMLEIKDMAQEDYNSELDIFFRKYKEDFGEDFGYKTYAEFRKKAPDKTGNSVLMSVLARMQPFRSEEIARILSRDDMHLELVGEEKTAIFIVVPPTSKEYSFISGMLFTLLFQEIQYCASVVHRHEGQRLPVPVRLICDEFKNTCKIPGFVEILAYARSFGVGISIILQSLEQIKEMYEKSWGTIIDNCSTFLYLGGVRFPETLNYIRDLLGKGTFDKFTTGRTRGRSGSSSRNEDVIGRSLLESDEIAKLDKGDCLLFVSGKPPFYSEKYVYEEHPNYRFTSDSNPGLSYEYKPDIFEENTNNTGFVEKLSENVSSKIISDIEIRDFSFELDQENALRRLARNINDYDFVDDDELVVDDGETTEAILNEEFAKEIMEVQEGGEIDFEKLSQLAAIKKKDEQKAKSHKVLPLDDENEVIYDTSLKGILGSLGKLITNLSDYDFVDDDELVVDDGETTEAMLTEEFATQIMSEESDVDEENIIEESNEELEMLLESLSETIDFGQLDDTIQSSDREIEIED